MKQANEETVIDTSTDDFEPVQLGVYINKNECLAFHARLHATSLDYLKKLKALPVE